ncbi:MAG: hypothetical protein Q8P55_00085 [bacterium]|nr:hypothetical protein [bacterium]
MAKQWRTGYEGLLWEIFFAFPRALPLPVQPESEALVYSFIVEEGTAVSLKDVLNEVLESLRHTKGRNDSQPWARLKFAVEQFFGLNDSAPRSFSAIDRELGGAGKTAKRLVENALFHLRHTQKKRLSCFFAPSPWRVAEIEKGLEKLHEILVENNELRIENADLRKRLNMGNPSPILSARAEAQLLQDAIDELLKTRTKRNIPQATLTALRGILSQERITTYSQLLELMETGKIRRVHGIGKTRERTCGEILQIAQIPKAPS